MSHFQRLKIAFVVAVTAVGVLMILDMVFVFHFESVLFSPVIFTPIFVVAYLAAPYVAKRIRYK